MLELAKKSIAAAARKLNLPEFDASKTCANLLQPSGCFVTLHIHGKLRGCIGQIFPRSPLYLAVMNHARNAATTDPRFAPVQPGEVDQTEIEISVLSDPEPLAFDSPEALLAQLTPLTDGVVLQIDGRIATFLPQVWAGIPDKVAFMESLSRKAESDPDAWRSPDAGVSTYQAESFALRP